MDVEGVGWDGVGCERWRVRSQNGESGADAQVSRQMHKYVPQMHKYVPQMHKYVQQMHYYVPQMHKYVPEMHKYCESGVDAGVSRV